MVPGGIWQPGTLNVAHSIVAAIQSESTASRWQPVSLCRNGELYKNDDPDSEEEGLFQNIDM